ncbi:MAG: glycosyltransferase [Bacteroidetes bacterium]|nr:glycosyltransferase [Bacteroidota bacterium]
MAKLSIITINYNNSVGLQKTINSVISQTFQDFEFIVIDGNSSDSSVDVIKQYHRINEWVSEKDNGIYDAQNKGILKATGDYLLFLNSGDILANNNVLQNVSPVLSGGKSFYYGNLILEKNSVKEKHIAPITLDIDFMLNSTFWHPCVFIKAELFKVFGLYNTSFKIAGDYEFFIRCLLKPNITTEYINEFITEFDGNGISNDAGQNELQLQEREKAWKLNISEVVYDSLKKQNAFSRSKYASFINSLQKIRGKQNF